MADMTAAACKGSPILNLPNKAIGWPLPVKELERSLAMHLFVIYSAR